MLCLKFLFIYALGNLISGIRYPISYWLKQDQIGILK